MRNGHFCLLPVLSVHVRVTECCVTLIDFAAVRPRWQCSGWQDFSAQRSTSKERSEDGGEVAKYTEGETSILVVRGA